MCEKTATIGDLWIPSELANDRRICWQGKALYSLIRNMITKNNNVDYCFATNQWFAEIFAVSVRSVTDWLTALENAGYIERRSIQRNGTAQRRIYLTVKYSNNSPSKNDDFFGETDSRNLPNPLEENFPPPSRNLPNPLEENCHHTRVLDNNNNQVITTEEDNNIVRVREDSGQIYELSTKKWCCAWAKEIGLNQIRGTTQRIYPQYSNKIDETIFAILLTHDPAQRKIVTQMSGEKITTLIMAVISNDKIDNVNEYVKKCVTNYAKKLQQSNQQF